MRVIIELNINYFCLSKYDGINRDIRTIIKDFPTKDAQIETILNYIITYLQTETINFNMRRSYKKEYKRLILLYQYRIRKYKLGGFNLWKIF